MESEEEMQMRYVHLKREIKQIQEAMLVSNSDEEFKMMLEMTKKKEKQLKSLAIDLNLFGTDDLSPRQLKKLRKEHGISEEENL